jgi:D-serine deaminase-like pyridoxal phosphate-dependent protein
MHITELATPAIIIDADALASNLASMAETLPAGRLRPHVKAHKCSALAARQLEAGHPGLTCATPREVIGLSRAGIDADLLLANEVLDISRLATMARAAPHVTIAVDSAETIAAAVAAGIRRCLVDVDIGLPRCGIAPQHAGALADLARAAGLEVRGVMGYEGHLMMIADRAERASRVADAMGLLTQAAADVGGEIISAGGTGTHDLHDLHADSKVTEIQAGSYALMDTHYAQLDLPFTQAVWVLGTVISVSAGHAVADVGLKALGMDHGNPEIAGSRVWFCSDEHITFGTDRPAVVADRVRVIPAHVDPTMAMHDTAWVICGDEVVDRWEIDLRGW